MAKKKELDKLSLDMIECEKAGYGVHYGAWKAAQEAKTGKAEKKEPEIPEGWLVCQQCGKAFKPKTKRPQKYCEPLCASAAQRERDRQKHREYMRTYRKGVTASG